MHIGPNSNRHLKGSSSAYGVGVDIKGIGAMELAFPLTTGDLHMGISQLFTLMLHVAN